MMPGLHRLGFYEKCQGSIGESLAGPTDLQPKDISSRTAAIAGFPTRALSDPELAIEDLQVLICAGILAGSSGSGIADIGWIAQQTTLSETAAARRLEQLELRGYLQRHEDGGPTMISLVIEPPDAGQSNPLPAHRTKTPSLPRRGATRSAQASLHSGMLRRPARRQSGAIEFDDPLPPHPVVASLQESVQSTSGGVDGFRFWLKTILDPEDVEIFSGWAGRQSREYRQLVHKFDNADDEHTIESLLEDTLALVNREKTPDR